jgi:hypothetical protein
LEDAGRKEVGKLLLTDKQTPAMLLVASAETPNQISPAAM